jgi:hypothetical protein
VVFAIKSVGPAVAPTTSGDKPTLPPHSLQPEAANRMARRWARTRYCQDIGRAPGQALDELLRRRWAVPADARSAPGGPGNWPARRHACWMTVVTAPAMATIHLKREGMASSESSSEAHPRHLPSIGGNGG